MCFLCEWEIEQEFLWTFSWFVLECVFVLPCLSPSSNLPSNSSWLCGYVHLEFWLFAALEFCSAPICISRAAPFAVCSCSFVLVVIASTLRQLWLHAKLVRLSVIPLAVSSSSSEAALDESSEEVGLSKECRVFMMRIQLCVWSL